MNGRFLLVFVGVLFVVGIVWMIGVTPEREASKPIPGLFEPVPPVSEDDMVAAGPTSADQEEPAPTPEETPPPPEAEKPEAEPEPEITQAASEEPPEVVEYTPAYGQVTFTHTMHIEDYGIDCGDCHHEDMEGGMAKCTNCHESPKKVLHKNCMGCHKDLQKEGKETGPVKCKDCHIK